ncbi:MAG: LysM peptidoglycan-binding domain-containing protein, partial [Chloroflexi bacterium]
MLNRRYFWLVLIVLALVGVENGRILAQTPEPTPPSNPIPQVHTVQSGENLTIIAQNYGVTVAELLTINGLTEEDILFAGQSLFIPGGEGEAVATVYTVQIGDSIDSIATAFNATPASILEANRAINAHYEFTVGQTVAVVSRTGSALPQAVTGQPHVVAPGETLNMIAARYNVNPMALAAENGLPYPSIVLLGQRLRIPAEIPYRFLPGTWVDVQIRPLPIIQGNTVSIYV